MSALDNGLTMAKIGIKVVPVHYPMMSKGQIICSCKKGADCKSVAKHPMPFEWQKGASSDPKLIGTWKTAFPKANLGVVAGQISGIFVLDVDPRHGGGDSLDALQVKHGKLPDTACVMTGGGGLHYYFKHPGKPVKNSAGAFGAGLDIRGDGGFVVGPGSIHVTGGIYDWEASSSPEDVGFQPAPDWLLKMAEQPERKSVTTFTDGQGIPEGGRNQWLASVAGALRCRGIDYQALLQMLLVANDHHCKPPLDVQEVDAVAKSYANMPGRLTK